MRFARVTRSDLAVLRPTQRVVGRFFTIEAYRNTGTKTPKITCVVPKKVEPLAVRRNTLRRRVRSALTKLPEGAITSAVLVCRSRPGASTASFAELYTDILELVSNLKAR